MAHSTTIPVVHLRGDARARGHAHGEALRAEIAETLAIYDDVFALPAPARDARAEPFAALVARTQPELAAEIDAIAAAAGVPALRIHAINARSELVSRLPPSEAQGECTAIYVPGTGVLAQNWDWLQRLEPLTRLLDIEHPDGHRMLTVTEPGIVGKIGLSSAGVGVCLNFLRSPHALDGLPVHVLLRALLDARTPEAAEALLATVDPSRSAHVLFGRADGAGVGIEYTGERSHRLVPRDGWYAHTNHFLAEPIDAGPGAANSKARLAAALARPEPEADWQRVAERLADRGDPDHPVCVDWRTLAGWDHGLMGTVCCVAMELGRGRMHLRLGPDPDAAWTHHDLAEAHAQDRLRDTA
ncbi:MAG TPA: C45 family peptidase [Pseudomonadales bacterium]|nr:C45 family peptidase [Pseudomonadales bacterium]